MIKILLFTLCLTQLDEYVIVKMSGTATLESKNVSVRLKPGDRIKDADIQNIHCDNSSVLRLASQKGTFLLKHNTKLSDPLKGNFSLATELRNELVPTHVSGELKSRAGLLNNLTGAQTFFSIFKDSINPMLVIDSLCIDVSKEFFTDTTDFFFFSYTYNNETINKKIPWKMDRHNLQLCLNKSISLIDGKNLNIYHIYNASLYFFKHTDKQAILISPINIDYETLSNIRLELLLLTEALGINKTEVASSKQINFIHDYLEAYYGHIDKEKLTNLIELL